MTENEAKFLEKLDELANDTEVDMHSVANLNFFFEESANTIRKLFEEIQQYRAIGTVEECKADKVLADKMYKYFMDDAELLKEYKAIGTIEECRVAVERMKPKKPTDIVMAKDRKMCVGRIGKCPCCGSIVAEDNFTCEDCFQVLNWSE